MPPISSLGSPAFPFMRELLHLDWLISTAIIIICFIIYWRTSELYRLTKHEGIRYFRYAFLFFSISFCAQWLFPVLRIFMIPPHVHMSVVSLYAGTVAVLSLLYSVLHERLSKISHPLLMMNAVGVLVAVGALLVRYSFSILILQAIVFSAALMYSYRNARKKRSHSAQIHVLYVLLFFSWIANAAANLALRESIILAVVLNIASLVFFIMIMRKFLRATHVK